MQIRCYKQLTITYGPDSEPRMRQLLLHIADSPTKLQPGQATKCARLHKVLHKRFNPLRGRGRHRQVQGVQCGHGGANNADGAVALVGVVGGCGRQDDLLQGRCDAVRSVRGQHSHRTCGEKAYLKEMQMREPEEDAYAIKLGTRAHHAYTCTRTDARMHGCTRDHVVQMQNTMMYTRIHSSDRHLKINGRSGGMGGDSAEQKGYTCAHTNNKRCPGTAPRMLPTKVDGIAPL